MKILFFGTSSFAAHILEFLIEHEVEVVGVVTRPDKPCGRSSSPQPSAVKALIQRKGEKIALLQPDRASTSAFVQELKKFHSDLFIVVAYGEILKEMVLEVPRIMPINVHASLLPKYRGAAPIHRALMEGEKETGITIMEMVLAMDAGDILEVVPVPIDDQINFGKLEEILWRQSGPALLRVMEKIEDGTLIKIQQNDLEATYAKKITNEDRKIDWKRSAQEIHNQIRALSPKPGAFCDVLQMGKRKKLTIQKSRCLSYGNEGEKAVAGCSDPLSALTHSLNKTGWVIRCGRGLLALERVQLEGKKSLTIQEFIRGVPSQAEIRMIQNKT